MTLDVYKRQQYKSINVVEIREGELVSWNPLTEEIEVDFSKRESDAVIGLSLIHISCFNWR